MYTVMRKATVLAIGLSLAIPLAAQAKTGVEFDSPTDTAKLGQKVPFTVIVYDENRRSSDGGLLAVAGRRPLITFTSQSGRVVRVRAGKTNRYGIGHGAVAFPDKGPWSTELHVGAIDTSPQESGAFSVDVGFPLIPTPHPATAQQHAAGQSDGAPWLWIVSLTALGSALFLLAMRRRGRWGAA